MKILIVGLGKVGYAIAQLLEGEHHDLTLVDADVEALKRAENSIDAMFVEGNGAGVSVLLQARVRESDLVIAVTENDEVNLICCLMAKKLGAKRTIARVRNPEYFREAPVLRRELGIDLTINPEYAAAQEIARILRVPAAFSVESLARGLVELIGFQITDGAAMAGVSLIEYNRRNPGNILICAAKRGDEVIVPDGNFVPQPGDLLYVIGSSNDTTRVLKSTGKNLAAMRRVSILGGGRIALYLAWALENTGARLTIVERDPERCLTLAEKLPKATVIQGDGTDHELLDTEGIFECDAFVPLTGRDEENLLMALSAQHAGVKKVLPKMSRPNYMEVLRQLGLETVISPKDITANFISRYVRGVANSQGSAVESLHKILDGSMEAVEFTASSATHILDTPLRNLHLKRGLLVAAVVREGQVTIPDGSFTIHAGDRVIIVARKLFLQDLNDILER
ncbi:MAG: Trk system potassium transporter TrkA [Ruminococcaceae bacterium]|nr:Trk system potassium transporter TrkA [Oscillospiraceae bacterium]